MSEPNLQSFLTVLQLYASAGTRLLTEKVTVKQKVGIGRLRQRCRTQANTVQTLERHRPHLGRAYPVLKSGRSHAACWNSSRALSIISDANDLWGYSHSAELLCSSTVVRERRATQLACWMCRMGDCTRVTVRRSQLYGVIRQFVTSI